VRTRWTQAGFSLVEVMVATLLLSAIALAVTQTLVNALQVRARSERWMQATQLAAEGIEQLRAGHSLRSLPAGSGFERSGITATWGGCAGVQRLDVTISWNDGEPRTFQLTTLARQ
jgi:prepilin-type N-terminal cleavage/methylation domain-containing protein